MSSAWWNISLAQWVEKIDEEKASRMLEAPGENLNLILTEHGNEC